MLCLYCNNLFARPLRAPCTTSMSAIWVQLWKSVATTFCGKLVNYALPRLQSLAVAPIRAHARHALAPLSSIWTVAAPPFVSGGIHFRGQAVLVYRPIVVNNATEQQRCRPMPTSRKRSPKRLIVLVVYMYSQKRGRDRQKMFLALCTERVCLRV